MNERHRALVILAAFGLLIAGGILVPLFLEADVPPEEAPNLFATPYVPAALAEGDLPTASALELSQAFRAVAKRVGPTVVTVATTQEVKVSRSPFGMPDDFFRRFFGEPRAPMPRGEAPKQQRQGLGSGFIIDAAGHILTNNHVVENADEIQVILADGRELAAEVIGTDPPTDIALIKVDAKDLPTVELGDSDQADVGDWVLAIGAPLGLQKTVTAGIVSATGRADVGLVDYEDFIQTDAAVNPGNSGGPLVDMNGRVIGINSAIASRSGGYQGISFAVPVNLARRVAERLKETGQVVRGWLGVGIQTVTEELAESMGLDAAEGVLINQVFEDGPAADAGLEAGDVIVRFGDTPVTDVNELRDEVAWTAPDAKVKVRVLRDGKPKTLTVTLGRRDEAPAIARGRRRPGGDEEPTEYEDLGITVGPLTDETAEQLGYGDAKGVLITGVTSGGLGDRAGLRSGMLILRVGGRRIEALADFRDAMKDADLERGVPMLVRVGDRQAFILVKKR